MPNATDSLSPIFPRAGDAEVWGIRVAGLVLCILAVLTWNTAADTQHTVDQQKDQIDALYDALETEQTAKVNQGESPVTPPAEEIRKNPNLVIDRGAPRCGILISDC